MFFFTCFYTKKISSKPFKFWIKQNRNALLFDLYSPVSFKKLGHVSSTNEKEMIFFMKNVFFFSVFYNKNHHQNYSIVHVINGQGWNQHCYHPRGRQNHRHSSTQRQHRRTDGHPPQNHHLSSQNSRAREHPVHCGQSPEQRGRGTHHHIRWGSLFMQASIFVGKNLPKCLVGFQKLSAAI